ncbi:hypothetical protein DICPUDRAFT_43464 [Dictyostelium purpureum]|uniref:Translation initiation factor eIF2B subunit gamma n=1 Tax=Dictyostelium purpureum TaxID=5786 RepID=F1A470_DICPU|nr:uncharacterized protein DICPUDRAFT_43464 [Dictyostelium purpureum]EGC29005.1 hypothetical protein DICPUDRAFT_43464 [Dictyostelium purpureum]|eukprot:XP_003294462.1 hypothetical protein DICPUDRAFT_43464 [Dictyostelium purpureum]
MTQTQFQVVILATDKACGNSRLSPIDDNIPHSLLPIANRPLISYQFEFLEKAGFETKSDNPIIIVVNEASEEKIRQHVSEIYKGLEVEFFVLKDRLASCEILYRIRDKIKSEYFIILNANLVLEETFIRQMADIHRSGEAAVTMLLKPAQKVVEQPSKKGAAEAPSSSKKELIFTDYIALDEKKEKVIMMEPGTEIEENLQFNKSLLKHFPNLTIYSDLQDTHFYIFSRWVLELIVEDQKEKYPLFSDIKKHLIPYLLSCQIPNIKRQRPLPESAFNLTQKISQEMSSTASPFNQFSDINIQKKKTIKCLAYILKNGYCMNVNTVKSYQQINRDISKGDLSLLPLEPKLEKNYFIDPAANVTPTQVGPYCVIGASSTLGSKCSVKFSIIGKHCKIGDNVRIENSIIMDHVNIEDKCTIKDSIICNDVFIKAGSSTVGQYLTK